MKLSEFDFHVPEELVAQRPLEQRSASKMLVLHRKSGAIEHRQFLDLPDYLAKPDLLIFNRSKVVKARLIGQRSTGGKVEIFMLRKRAGGHFECLIKATAAEKEGLEVGFGDFLQAKVIRKLPDGMTYEVAFEAGDGRVDFWLEKLGRMPLPPYIRRDADGLDVGRYQTVYAEDLGSVAAPTAGLHFTESVFETLRAKGVRTGFLSLHVGLGTFQPIKTDTIDEHKMHEEHFSIPPELWAQVQAAKSAGERVIAVGTTAVRALESKARGKEGFTDLFLKPGSEFKVVDALFTNFHQPKSSLIVMLSAFVGSKELLFEAYRAAVAEKYRFFSYGDCMLVVE
ncbi:MAG: tRNA preQ1(34) S-adenosylmethionine ribosyltransferase-isomerase QueA [Bdellovibrionota bacterium]